MENWRDRRVLVTGCSGLLGSWLTELLLERGAHVVGLIRDDIADSRLRSTGTDRRIDVVRGELESAEKLERVLAEYEIQDVFHLAAQTIVGIANRSPISTFEANIRGTWCLLEASRRCGYNPLIVVASSDKAYGEQTVLPYSEDMPLRANHPYDVSKSCADMLAQTYAHSYRMPIAITRCGNLYGGGDFNWNRIVPGTIRSVVRGIAPEIRSDGSPVRDYFYVRDAAEAYLHLAECLRVRPELSGHAFNFSTEQPLSALQIVDRILKAANSTLQPVVLNRASNEILHQYLSSKKARDLLGWESRDALDESLRATVRWYREYFASGEVGRTSPRIAA